jgi:hypothetical protein
MRVLDLGTGLGHIDYDIGCSRAEPEVPLVARALSWIEAAFRAATRTRGSAPRLIPILRDAGFADVTGFGVQAYYPPGDPTGSTQLAGVVRSLAAEIEAADAVILPPTVAGAWGRLRS